ncbi:ABC transporter ATP-binding protein [Chelatococcus sambhunathii]|uniref:ABC transporter ATP-binding protein n=1 Tax=Chelatococcus sambhunathii TaxID=363953 RepID=A0ABU1DIN9_9HYPH|nr:dipeptide/oligopeptide/nickel ABC transporter ATP-binding protein [Chelatococcus sambhunathii]MDR4307972.1 ABC transporter ATP-binding protein [Chelatococcus sambhunathii]
MAAPETVLEASGLTKRFGGGFFARRDPLTAVDAVSLNVRRGETLGIVGESGSGKSTLARMLVGLIRPTSGAIALDGRDVDPASAAGRAALRRRAQFVFQDSASAFNPRRTIGASLSAPLIGLTRMTAREREPRVAELLEQVGLRAEHAGRYPHAFSGGQLQRAGVARALAAEPEIVVLDEPVSALDVSVQAQILALLRRLKDERGLTMVFVSHDLAVAEALCDRVAVMRRGRIVEEGAAREVIGRPRDDYVRALVAAARDPAGRLAADTPVG